jgi:hypothetical protein
MAEIKTLSFKESSGLIGGGGWTSFWDYNPLFAFSLNGRYFTATDSSIYEHYNGGVYSNFYGTQYSSEVTLIFNPNPSMPKNFKTVNYEGSNGWEVSLIESDEYAPSSNEFGSVSVKDSALSISSYSEGKYIDGGVSYRAGFDRKENKYYAEIKGNGDFERESSVLPNNTTSGIKGFFCTVTIKTDNSTLIGGNKQLFSVTSEYVQSS